MMIHVKKFSEYPGLRYCNISHDSGEKFYHDYLNTAFKEAYEKQEPLTVNLDGTAGYAPSFLDEAFGNLVYDFTKDIVEKYLEIISTQEPDLKDEITKETYEDWQNRRAEKDKPKKTQTHKPWYRLVDDKIIKVSE